MKKIKAIDFDPFKNNEHGQFHTDAKVEMVRATPEVLGITVLFPTYTAALEAEQAALVVEEGSRFTMDVVLGDDYRDRYYRGFVLHTKENMLDLDPEVQAAGHAIMRIIEQVGDMRKQNYHEESKTLTGLVFQLETNYMPDLVIADSVTRITKLKGANNLFIQNFGTRAEEEAVRISGDVRLSRGPVDDWFHNIATVVNAMVMVHGEGPYAEFIDRINYLIDYHKNTIKMRKARRPADPDSTTPPPTA